MPLTEPAVFRPFGTTGSSLVFTLIAPGIEIMVNLWLR